LVSPIKEIKYEAVLEVRYLMVRIDMHPYWSLIHSSMNDFYFDGIDDEQHDEPYEKPKRSYKKRS
jgi:hypothetical protein